MEAGNSRCKRIALLVQYDGTDFNGWQIQNNGRTVQGEIEKAIFILTKESVKTICSGRTDTGVHALGQVVHFDINKDIQLKRLCIGLNGILSHDVSVKNAYNVYNEFHARFSAKEREYIYAIYNAPQRTPFMRYRSMWVRDTLDIDYLQKASAYLIGEMDFASFCKKRDSALINTKRRINSINIQKIDNVILFTINGNAFLHNMIRIIIGTIVEMNKRRDDPELIKDIINKCDRDFSGITAPPYGLYLNRIIYDPPLSCMESAF